jgi:hypothetical protein
MAMSMVFGSSVDTGKTLGETQARASAKGTRTSEKFRMIFNIFPSFGQ